MASPVVLRGYRELSSAFAKAERDARLGFRREFREIAEPVRLSIEQLARESITRIGPRWSQMRIGVTRTVVYVAPKQRGVKGRDNPRARPKFGTLLMQRAMEPGLARHQAEIEARVEAALDHLADRWEP